MRVFLAVRIPERVRGQVGAVIHKLARSGADVKWVEGQNLHLTLRFLGEVSDGQRSRLEQALQHDSGYPKSFTMTLAGMGGFPSLERPRVLWVGVTSGQEALGALAQVVENACLEAGFPPADRPLSGHLTIGRVRSARGLPQFQQALSPLIHTTVGDMPVTQFELVQSRLSPQGPTYDTLQVFPL